MDYRLWFLIIIAGVGLIALIIFLIYIIKENKFRKWRSEELEKRKKNTIRNSRKKVEIIIKKSEIIKESDYPNISNFDISKIDKFSNIGDSKSLIKIIVPLIDDFKKFNNKVDEIRNDYFKLQDDERKKKSWIEQFIIEEKKEYTFTTKNIEKEFLKKVNDVFYSILNKIEFFIKLDMHKDLLKELEKQDYQNTLNYTKELLSGKAKGFNDILFYYDRY